MKLLLSMKKLEKFWILKSKILSWNVQPTIDMKKNIKISNLKRLVSLKDGIKKTID